MIFKGKQKRSWKQTLRNFKKRSRKRESYIYIYIHTHTHIYWVGPRIHSVSEYIFQKSSWWKWKTCLLFLLKNQTNFLANHVYREGLPWWLSGKESACNAGDPGSVPGRGRSSGGGHGKSLQYCCLENPMDRGAWQATVHGVTQSQTQLKWLSNSSSSTEREGGFPGGLDGKESSAMQGLTQEDPLEKEMASHLSVLVWSISQTEELGRLQS